MPIFVGLREIFLLRRSREDTRRVFFVSTRFTKQKQFTLCMSDPTIRLSISVHAGACHARTLVEFRRVFFASTRFTKQKQFYIVRE